MGFESYLKQDFFSTFNIVVLEENKLLFSGLIYRTHSSCETMPSDWHQQQQLSIMNSEEEFYDAETGMELS